MYKMFTNILCIRWRLGGMQHRGDKDVRGNRRRREKRGNSAEQGRENRVGRVREEEVRRRWENLNNIV